MKTLGIVPARAGSQRIPGKNLRLLGDRPLVVRAIETALGSRAIHKLVVSSDDAEVLDISRSFPDVISLARPPKLATASSPAIEYVKHALATIDQDGSIYDSVAIVQPSSPFTRAIDIDETINLLKQRGTDSAVSVTELPHMIHPMKLKTLDGNLLIPLYEHELERMSPEQMPRVFVRNGSVYATWRKTVASGSILGNHSRAHVMPRALSVDINEEEDLRFAEFLLSTSRPV